MTATFRPEFIARYAAPLQQYEKAHMRLREGDADDTLTAARKSLEFFVRGFSQAYGLPVYDTDTGRPKTIEELINGMSDYGFLNNQECAVLHRLRKLGNIGSHDLGSMDDAWLAVELLDSAVMIFDEKDTCVTDTPEQCAEEYQALLLNTQKGGTIWRLASQHPFAYQLVSEVSALTQAVPVYAAGKILFTEDISRFWLYPAMILVIAGSWAQSQTGRFFHSIPMPRKKRCRTNRWLHDMFAKVFAVMLVIILVWLLSTTSGFFAKLAIGAALILSVAENDTLRGFYKRLWD